MYHTSFYFLIYLEVISALSLRGSYNNITTQMHTYVVEAAKFLIEFVYHYFFIGLSTSFSCGLLFLFNGSSSLCSWISPVQVRFQTTSLVPGSKIILRPDWYEFNTLTFNRYTQWWFQFITRRIYFYQMIKIISCILASLNFQNQLIEIFVHD